MDVKKAFDSLDRASLISAVKKTLDLVIMLLVGLQPLSHNKIFVKLMVGILLSIFSLKEGFASVTLSWSMYLALPWKCYSFWLKTIRISKGSMLLIIYIYIQLMSIIQLFILKTRNQ